MRPIKLITVIFALCAMTFLLADCSKGGKSDQQMEHTKDMSGPEYTSAYVCPMHCKGSGSDKPGLCSVCGMDLVMNQDHPMHQEQPDTTAQEHDAGMDDHGAAIAHACPMHPEITGKQGDKCSKCGMDLEPVEVHEHAQPEYE